ncbi:hypothetical protein SDRG_04895 [Saprolegnia diclina VS20]|uniref:Uncharacterized protein n=1 Tax=Saprolegnia diclina (strain VS20) TaxID=1156394 RepID=T0QIP7_SAPDV|nr:hypothetical protein SDRG_04895 [Saprolegnia diclina VS20]EQC37874.1 hypothetical protein SDRG_04895 [Saprolegnia diclina VS20]|eukprot:XP_008608807.1 hypothetical protein SDRG_04895 [Saprolegnia diclina VS20]
MLKRTLPTSTPAEYPSKIQILYPRPDQSGPRDAADDAKPFGAYYSPHLPPSLPPQRAHYGEWPKPQWEPSMEHSESGKPMLYPRSHDDQSALQHNTPQQQHLHPPQQQQHQHQHAHLQHHANAGPAMKRSWREMEEHFVWQRETKRREDEFDDAPILAASTPPPEPVSSPTSSDVLEKDDEKLLSKASAGKKRNRMKDEIDTLRKEIFAMTKQIDTLKAHHTGKHAPRGKVLWADIAKQQEAELGRVVHENQQLRQTLEEHLGIAQDYLDSILPKQPPTKDVSALPVIMCL